jgi:O-acetyl-ADP-ribose deacetylase (regulator of RNase III)
MFEIKLIKGDLTKQHVDAIVNAANTSLLGGGGVDGAIHRAAGPELLSECRLLNGCETGSAKVTRGYKLFAKHVIHAVGPIWRGGNNNESGLLASCYKTSLDIANQLNLKSIAFPNISTGVYGFPKDKAAEIVVKTLKSYSNKELNINEVVIVCFDDENYELYKKLLNDK